jgi:hypothetical protein
MENFNFVAFNDKGGKTRGTNLISITNSYKIGFGCEFFSCICNFRYVSFSYDKNFRALGFYFYLDKQPGSYKISNNGKGAYVDAYPFLSFFLLQAHKANISLITLKSLVGKYLPQRSTTNFGMSFYFIDLGNKAGISL